LVISFGLYICLIPKTRMQELAGVCCQIITAM